MKTYMEASVPSLAQTYAFLLPYLFGKQIPGFPQSLRDVLMLEEHIAESRFVQVLQITS